MKEGFLAIIEENKGLIFKIVRMYGKTSQDRQDLFQDIVLQLWRSYPSFREASKVSTWIYQVGINTALTRLRKEKKAVVATDLNLEAMQIPSSNAQEEQDTASVLYTAMGYLSDVEKSIILLYMDDKSYREIAEIIGISESNVGFKLNKIKAKLKQLANTLGYGTERI